MDNLSELRSGYLSSNQMKSGVGFPNAAHLNVTNGPGTSVCSLNVRNSWGGASLTQRNQTKEENHVRCTKWIEKNRRVWWWFDRFDRVGLQKIQRRLLRLWCQRPWRPILLIEIANVDVNLPSFIKDDASISGFSAKLAHFHHTIACSFSILFIFIHF